MKRLHSIITARGGAHAFVRPQLELSLIALAAGLLLGQPCAATPSQWKSSRSINSGGSPDTGTFLSNDKVLVESGLSTQGALTNAEAAAETAEGRGSFDNQGDAVTFRFHVSQAGGNEIGHFEFCDPGADVCVGRARVSEVSVENNSTFFSGSVRLEDGTQATFNVSAIEDPISGISISVSLSNGYLASGMLISGSLRFF